MSDDIVTDLRRHGELYEDECGMASMAAGEIERLRAEVSLERARRTIAVLDRDFAR